MSSAPPARPTVLQLHRGLSALAAVGPPVVVQRVNINGTVITHNSTPAEIQEALGWTRNFGIQVRLSKEQLQALLDELKQMTEQEQEELTDLINQVTESVEDSGDDQEDDDTANDFGFDDSDVDIAKKQAADLDADFAEQKTAQQKETERQRQADFDESVAALTFDAVTTPGFRANHVLNAADDQAAEDQAAQDVATTRNIGTSTSVVFDANAKQAFLAEVKQQVLQAGNQGGNSLQNRTTRDTYSVIEITKNPLGGFNAPVRKRCTFTYAAEVVGHMPGGYKLYAVNHLDRTK